MEEQERRTADRELREESLVALYGDIGLGYHMLFESQRETFSRPDFRLHLGVFGTAFNVDGQRVRYDLRLTTLAEGENGKPAPTLSWLPFPGYGAPAMLSVDRFLIEFEFERVFGVTGGRFPSPYTGSEILFDEDYNFQGLYERARLDRLFSETVRRVVPRLELVGVQGYLAQNNLGLPAPTAEAHPIYLGGQFRIDLAPFERPVRAADGSISPEITSDLELRLAVGIHWYDGEEGIASNLGVGYIKPTTNVLAADGLVQSEFLVGEVYFETVLLRSRRAQVRAWFHGLFNFHAEPEQKGRAEKNDQAFEAGAAWGMEQLVERWDFYVGFRYFLIEADAAIPEFNGDLLNTNIKGWQVDLKVRVFPTVTAYGSFSLTEREDYELAGFGFPSRGDPSRSGGQSFRLRFGLFLEF